LYVACQKIVQARLAASGFLVGRSNTPNHVGPVGGPAVRGYHGQSAAPPLPPHPLTHGGSGAKSFDAQSHSSSGSGSAPPPPLTPTGITAGHHVRVIILCIRFSPLSEYFSIAYIRCVSRNCYPFNFLIVWSKINRFQ